MITVRMFRIALEILVTALACTINTQHLYSQSPLLDQRQSETGSPVSFPSAPQQISPTASNAVDVYLFGGQSNMQGIGKIADLPKEIPMEIPHTYFWSKRSFEPLVLGTTQISTRIAEFGPEIGFALQIATAARPIYIVKYHASGMPLHHGWNGSNWIGGPPAPGRRNFYPGENSIDVNTGMLYAAMRAEFQSAVKHLSEAGLTPNVRGFLWMQGEQDSKQLVSASSYAASLNLLRKRLAEDMSVGEDMPLVFGQVLPHEPPAERFTHRNELRQQMAACDFASGRPESMKNAVMVSTDGFTLLPDTVHYDAAGQLKLGTSFGHAMKKLYRSLERNDVDRFVK